VVGEGMMMILILRKEGEWYFLFLVDRSRFFGPFFGMHMSVELERERM